MSHKLNECLIGIIKFLDTKRKIAYRLLISSAPVHMQKLEEQHLDMQMYIAQQQVQPQQVQRKN